MLAELSDTVKDEMQKEQKSEEAKIPIMAMHAMYNEGKAFLENNLHIQLLPDISCKTTGFHRLYKEAEPVAEIGLNYPPDFKYFRPITLHEYGVAQDTWLRFDTGAISEPIRMFWSPLFMPKSASIATPLQLYTMQILELQAIHDAQMGGAKHEVGISFTPSDCLKNKTWARAFIPELEWFSSNLLNSGLKPKDFLTLFPDAEADLLTLCFGRAVVGRTGHVPVGRTKQIEHTFRTMPVLFGAEPGQGKSTLANYVINAMKSVGYTVANFNSMNSRFNLGSVINSHIALTL